MSQYTTSKTAQVTDIKGNIQVESASEQALQAGEIIPAGTKLNLAEGSELFLTFEDGSEQRIVAASEENLIVEEQDSSTAIAQTVNQSADQSTPDNVQADINAIQDLIESGDDIELPDTAAGGLVGNEGTDFVTLNRDGNELLAGAGYDTAELDNPTTPVNEPELQARSEQPTLTQPDTNTVAEDITATGNVLSNDSDADDVLSVQSYTVEGDNTVYLVGQTAIVEGGNLVINQDGSYTFTPAENYNGVLPVVTYTTNTNASDTLTITVTPVSDLIDGDEIVSTAEDTSVTGNVLNNATSADGEPLVIDFTISDTTFSVGETAELIEGNLTVNQDGSYSFVPAENFNGDVPVVTYTVSDGVNTDTSTLTIVVTPESDLTDADEVVSLAEDTSVSGNVLNNAASADGEPLVVDFTINDTTFTVGETAALTEGNLTVNQDGSYSFVPAENFNGDVPVVTYTVSDGVNTDTSTLTIVVTPESDLTDADEVVSLAEDTSVSGNVLNNAASADGEPLVVDFTINDTTFVVGETAELTEGNLTINQDGSYSFVPAENFNGEVPIVTYTVSDGVNTDISTLSINVTPESDLTDADESVSTAEDTNVSGNVLTNAASTDGTPVITGFVVAGSTTAYAAGDTANLTEGDLTINADGSYTFAPATNYNGPVPVATYTVSDGVNTDTSTLTIAVTPVSDLTDADESVSTAEDTNVSGSVLTNAASTDGTPVITGFVVAGSTTAYAAGDTAALTEGDLTINADGSYTFAPATNYNGPVPVATYTVSDGVNTDTSTLNIQVTPENEPPVATDDNFSVNEGQSVSGNVITHNDGDGVVDTDGGDGAVLTVTQVNGVDLVFDPVTGQARVDIKDGFILIKADGSFTYTHNGNDPVGAAPSFNYTLSDGTDVDTGNVSIAVTPVNDPPVAADDNFSVNEGAAVSGNVITHNDGDGVVDTDGGDGATMYITQINGVDLNFDPISGEAIFKVIDGVLTAISPAEALILNDSVFNGESDNGVLRINAEGAFTYDNRGFLEGSNPVTFEYTLSDGTNTDTANVTIAVEANAPDAVDDNNYILLTELPGNTAFDEKVIGNVISGGSTGDNRDQAVDGFGSPVITQVVYDGNVYSFSATVTSHKILTDFGTLTINSSGAYSFETPFGMAMPPYSIEGTDIKFTYTIQDGDLINPDVDTAVLTINLNTRTPPPPQPKDVSIDFDQITGTIDTALDENSLSHADEAAFVYAPDIDGDNLSDILIDGNTDGLEKYLAIMGSDEDALVNGNMTEVHKDMKVEDAVILENDQSDLLHTLSATITNGLLADGAIIMSDTVANPASAPIAEIDSPEVL